MKCRRTKNENTSKSVVWFGSYGVNEDGTAKFYNTADKHDNFATLQEAVAETLTQKLSVLKNELWYDFSYGLPFVTEKNKSKTRLDAFILDVVQSNVDVVSILTFTSTVSAETKKYSCYIEIETRFGATTISI